MANRKFLIESIMGLAQKLGANPNKFMGTKQNINFLGTGDKGMKGTTFSGKIDENFIDLGFTKDDLVRIIEQDAGYVTAGKLNDVQLNTMYNNLLKIDETFNPPPGPMNVIDLKTGTGNLNKEGLESLRTEQMSFTDKIGEGINTLKTKLKAPFNVRSAVDDIERVENKAAEESFLKTGAANFGDSVEAEGARRAVVRQVLAKDPDFFMLPPETVESMVKFKDLQRGGANAPDPLVVFRNMGNFTDKELKQIDFIIDQKLFDDTSIIADDVLEYIKEIRPEGFRQGFRGGKSVQGLLSLINKRFGKDTMKVADEIDRPESALSRDLFKAFNDRYKNKLDIDEDIAIRAKELKMDKNQKDLDYVENLYKVHRKDEAGVGTLKEYHADFEEATGLKVPMENLRTAWRQKRSYPFTTPVVDLKGNAIGAQATQKMYPESPKFIVEDAETLTKNINDMKAGKIPRSPTGERIGLDVEKIPAGFKLSRSKLSEQFPELSDDMLDAMMDLDNDMLARTIKMLENRRLDPVAYDKLLLEKGDTLEFQAAFDKITRRKNNAKGGLARILEM